MAEDYDVGGGIKLKIDMVSRNMEFHTPKKEVIKFTKRGVEVDDDGTGLFCPLVIYSSMALSKKYLDLLNKIECVVPLLLNDELNVYKEVLSEMYKGFSTERRKKPCPL